MVQAEEPLGRSIGEGEIYSEAIEASRNGGIKSELSEKRHKLLVLSLIGWINNKFKLCAVELMNGNVKAESYLIGIGISVIEVVLIEISAVYHNVV